jgi:hypothetical protein
MLRPSTITWAISTSLRPFCHSALAKLTIGPGADGPSPAPVRPWQDAQVTFQSAAAAASGSLARSARGARCWLVVAAPRSGCA